MLLSPRTGRIFVLLSSANVFGLLQAELAGALPASPPPLTCQWITFEETLRESEERFRRQADATFEGIGMGWCRQGEERP